MVDNRDLMFLRKAIAVAKESRAEGNHPFGALLVSADGSVLMEQGNDAQSGDRTAHAERVLMSRASLAYPRDVLAHCTMYSSAEPCAMCAGAAYWVGLGRVVYGLSERALKALIGPHPENLTMDFPCRQIFLSGQRTTEVIGPLIEKEAETVHFGFWS